MVRPIATARVPTSILRNARPDVPALRWIPPATAGVAIARSATRTQYQRSQRCSSVGSRIFIPSFTLSVILVHSFHVLTVHLFDHHHFPDLARAAAFDHVNVHAAGDADAVLVGRVPHGAAGADDHVDLVDDLARHVIDADPGAV